MDARSSAVFRSNIYPTSTRGELVNDRRFLDAISDTEALDILWHYNGSQGSKLNPLQRRQHDMAKHCAYAEEGDFPWGTPVGDDKVVCLCARMDCPLYQTECSRYHPAWFDPERYKDDFTAPAEERHKPAIRSKSRPVAKSKPVVRSKSMPTAGQVISPRTQTAVSRPEKTHVVAKPSQDRVRQGALGPWTQHEDDVLCEMYPLYGISVQRWSKRLPGRSTGEILDRAHELRVRYVPRRERGSANSRVQVKSYGSRQVRAQDTGAKKAKREAMRRRPWDPQEDDVIRRMYPLYGANMTHWTEKLTYRTKEAIEARAKQLGL